MSLYVNTNVTSLNSQRKLNNATNSLNTTYQRLASGLRINSAKDDAAGLQISDRMTSQINGLNQGNRNANDGIAMAQTTEGAMDEITTMLQRMRTLAVQSSNGTNTAADRQSIQKEMSQLSEEINRISDKTTFNGQRILAGSDADNSLLDKDGKISFQVGSNANDTLSVDLSQGFSMAQMGNSVNGTTAKAGDSVSSFIDTLDDQYGATLAGMTLEVVDGETDIANGKISVDDLIYLKNGDNTGNLASGMVISGNTAATNNVASNSTLGDTQIQNIKNDIINNGSGYTVKFGADSFKSLINGAGGGSAEGTALVNEILAGAGCEFGVGTVDTTTNTGSGTATTMVFNASTAESSQNLITMIDSYLGVVDSARADLGAVQNRMESTIRNQSNIAENTSDARSRIRDTDFAEETANLSQQSIIQQAASSMLMQANQRPQLALSLLG